MVPRHTSHYHTRMGMWPFGGSKITPEGYTNVDAFSTPDDRPKSSSPTNDPFMKYAEDPPVLIA